ncbi:hypothetical protein [Pseudofrankia sp. DC12]|uniref:hypothetical protein n=1 Tax=Pseudofrankia sp. DC12 TaxID=683315 RepID=UPI0006966D59|nr:hypothetical protein [Pseudofrankia sp. DC12]
MTRLLPPDHEARALARVHADITRPEKLNERRERGYPRVVRRARHNHYKVKSPGQHGIRYDAPATIRLARTSGPAPQQRERTRTRRRPATAVRRVRADPRGAALRGPRRRTGASQPPTGRIFNRRARQRHKS